MTLPEFLGIVGALFFGIAASVATFILGYGGLVVGLAFPVGCLAGWMIGASTAGLVNRALMESADDKKVLEDREQKP